jgi:predicted  nucleic acid-binding Zn-ribbon protein
MTKYELILKKIQVLKNTASQNSSFTLSELELIEALKKEKAELLKDIQQKEKELSEKDKKINRQSSYIEAMKNDLIKMRKNSDELRVRMENNFDRM